ncbi:fimbrial protein [Escherichia coli]|uniref:fimbrial protein n=1 Tax=Escherichia coli TaxID=562 RepID=UPI002FF194E7
MNNRKLHIKSLIIGCFYLSFPFANAMNVPINITGTIYSPPCKIENDKNFKVSFGKISLQKVNGMNYATQATVMISCSYFQGQPYIHLSGGTGLLPGAPDNVLKTTGVNHLALGIALYQGQGVDSKTPLRVGNRHEIIKGLSAVNKRNSKFTFTAVPYKKDSTKLEAGTFNASVMMNISYH